MGGSDGERIARLEERVSNMDAALKSMIEKVDEMHAVLLQAKGAKWAIIAIAGLAGYLAGWMHKLVPVFFKS